MASWNITTKHEPNSINNGNRYEKKDRLSRENINAITENSFYAVNEAEKAIELAKGAAQGNGTILTLDGEIIASMEVDTTPQESGTNKLVTSAGVANALKNFTPSGGNEYDDTELRGLINGKVDKVAGKGLSTNDYTDAEKAKLAGLENYNDTLIKNQVNAKASLDASNLSTANVEKWKEKLGVGEGGGDSGFLPLGTIIPSAVLTDDARLHLLDGTDLSQTGIYEQFCTWLKNRVLENSANVPTCTIEEYALSMDLYGQCGKFVINDTQTSLISTNIDRKYDCERYNNYRLNSSGSITSHDGVSVIYIPVNKYETISITRKEAPPYNYIYETDKWDSVFTNLAFTNPEFQTTQTYTVKNPNTKYVVITVNNSDLTHYFVVTNANTQISMPSKSIKLPTIIKFIEGLSDISDIGKVLPAGLPNITGERHLGWPDQSGGGIIMRDIENIADSALYATQVGEQWFNASTNTQNNSLYLNTINIDASRSSPIYGNSDTVQPDSIKYPYYMVVATSYKTDIQVNIDNVATDIKEIKNRIENTERVDLLFDITNPSKDWGYSAGIPSDTSITGKDFSKYKRLVGVFGEAGNAQWEVQVDLTLPTNYNSDLYVGYNSFSSTDSAFYSQMLSKLGSLQVKNNKTTLTVHSGYSYNGDSTFTAYYWLMSLRGYY